MTVTQRRHLYHLYFLFALVVLLLALLMLLVTKWADLEQTRFIIYDSLSRQNFISGLICCFFCLLLAAISTGVIAFGIGKNVSVEIFFCSLWALGLSMESGRLLIIWFSRQEPNMELLSIITRAVLFGRGLSLYALFMASIFSVGFKNERLVPTALVIVFAALLFASIQPLNSGMLEQDFLITRGYRRLAWTFDLAIICIMTANNLMAWRNNGSRIFLVSGAASLAMILPLFVLRGSPSIWLALVMVAITATGTWTYLKKMYGYYLWR